MEIGYNMAWHQSRWEHLYTSHDHSNEMSKIVFFKFYLRTLNTNWSLFESNNEIRSFFRGIFCFGMNIFYSLLQMIY